MERYTLNSKRIDKETSRVAYSTIIHPKIERHENDIYIRTRYGDRLDNMAFEYYKDVTLWWIIAEANELGKGTLAISPGTQLRIPMQTDTIIADFEFAVTNRIV